MVLIGAFAVTVNAKNLPTVAAKLPASFKQEIVKQLDYPEFAKTNNMEGEVWMKVSVDETAQVRIMDISATSQELGEHVKAKLKDLKVENTDINGEVYFLKVKFDLLKKK